VVLNKSQDKAVAKRGRRGGPKKGPKGIQPRVSLHFHVTRIRKIPHPRLGRASSRRTELVNNRRNPFLGEPIGEISKALPAIRKRKAIREAEGSPYEETKGGSSEKRHKPAAHSVEGPKNMARSRKFIKKE